MYTWIARSPSGPSDGFRGSADSHSPATVDHTPVIGVRPRTIWRTLDSRCQLPNVETAGQATAAALPQGNAGHVTAATVTACD